MQKFLLTGLLVSLLLTACESGRNIDVADRERRLNIEHGNGPTGGKPKDDTRIVNLSVGQVQIFEAEKKITFVLSVEIFRSDISLYKQSLILADLQNLLLYVHQPEGMKLIGSIDCAPNRSIPCRTFKMKETLSTFFPEVNIPSLNDKMLEVTGVSSSGDRELMKKINDVWTSMGTMSRVAFNVDFGATSGPAPSEVTFYSFPSTSVPDNPKWFFMYYLSGYHSIPFYDPVPGYQLIDISGEKNSTDLAFAATYLNIATGQTLTQQYRVDHVQK